MVLSETLILQGLAKFLLPFFRIMAMFMTMPILSASFVYQKIKVILALAIALIIYPSIVLNSDIDFFSLNAVLLIFKEILIGLFFGFTLKIVFEIFHLAGQLIAMQAGLGFAAFVDPKNHENIPVLGQIYMLLITLVFLSFNGHLNLIASITNSFVLLPIDKFIAIDISIPNMVAFATIIFTGAIKVALPVIISLLIVNFAFGIMTKAAPQLNMFSLGFPITLLFALILVYLTIANVPEPFLSFLEQAKANNESLVGENG